MKPDNTQINAVLGERVRALRVEKRITREASWATGMFLFFPRQNPIAEKWNSEEIFPKCWMNTRKTPARSGSSFVTTSRNKLHSARKKKAGIDKFLSRT